VDRLYLKAYCTANGPRPLRNRQNRRKVPSQCGKRLPGEGVAETALSLPKRVSPMNFGALVLQPVPRYNLSMSRSAAEILEEARQLPPGELDWLVQNLLHEGDDSAEEERFAAWQKDVGEPEPGYDEWFRAGVEEALADTSPDVPHEVVVKEIAALLRTARESQRLKASA